eukprot:s7410_g1.t1
MAFTDVYDSAISSLALAQRLAEHRARMHHTHGASSAGLGSGDQWYVDRQAFVRLDITDEWLRSVDAVFAVGGSRSAGECKSHAGLLCTPAYAASIGPSSSPKARAAVEGLQDPAVELTLKRCCLSNSKASHLLRCNGDRVDAGRLLLFDEDMAAGLASALCDRLPDDSWVQATLSVDAGGLGMREASTIAMLAFTSRVASRPMAEMCQHSAGRAVAETGGPPAPRAPGGEPPHSRTAHGALSLQQLTRLADRCV